LSLEAIRLIGESLEDAVKDGKNLEARSKMAWASYIAGLSFSNAGLGIVHSMAHQLGSEYDLPHGVANALLLPYVEEFNSVVCEEKFKNIAQALGRNVEGLTVTEAKNEAIQALKEMAVKLNIPLLKDTSFNPDDAERLSVQAFADVCTGGNPREVTVADIQAIYMKAFRG